jgi:hypothetical protein
MDGQPVARVTGWNKTDAGEVVKGEFQKDFQGERDLQRERD